MSIAITNGDILHVYGGLGLGIDYTVRLSIKMKDEVDGDMLTEALKNTEKRYPYLSLRLMKDEQKLYYEENAEPVTIHNTDKKISLASDASNYHMWAVCYKDDRIFLDIFHGICDGTGMYMVLSTLLYYYCAARYGVTDHTGIRTLDDPILPQESIDPADHMPEMDISKVPVPKLEDAFSIIDDVGLTPCEPKIYDIIIPEAPFVKFSSENDASPGTMISILFSRAIDELYPDRDKPLRSSYVVNCRPMLGALETHHNCVNTIKFEYTDKIKAMPFDRQCTVHRGTTFVQSDADRVKGAMMVTANRNRMVEKMAPTLEAKEYGFGQMMSRGKKLFTYMVSYVGQWKHKALAPYVTEFWTHVPGANCFLTEIAAINGNIFLSVHQNFIEEDVMNKFIELLDRDKIGYEMRDAVPNDIASFKPW